jgi:hypothetical protein
MGDAESPFFVFNTHVEAEEEVQLLNRAGFDVKKLSLIGKGYHSEEHPIGFYTAGERIKACGAVPGLSGGRVGVAACPGCLLAPWARPDGDGGAAGGGTGRCTEPDWRTERPGRETETALKADHYVLMVQGGADEVARAGTILANAKTLKAA